MNQFDYVIFDRINTNINSWLVEIFVRLPQIEKLQQNNINDSVK